MPWRSAAAPNAASAPFRPPLYSTHSFGFIAGLSFPFLGNRLDAEEEADAFADCKGRGRTCLGVTWSAWTRLAAVSEHRYLSLIGIEEVNANRGH